MFVSRIPMNIGAKSSTNTEKVTISETVTKLIYHATVFDGPINIPEGTTKLRGYLFNDCWPDSPFIINVPEGVTSIASHAFSNCSIDTVSLPSTITSLPDDLFTDASPEKVIINKPKGSISGYPWGADNSPVIEWKG